MAATGEPKTFSELCDHLISANPSNRQLENAVIELEVAFKTHVNALKRDFNTELDEIRTSVNQSSNEDLEALQRQVSQLETQREDDKAHFQAEVERVTEDYKRQLDKASESYKKEVQRIQDHYDSLMNDRKHSGMVVQSLQEDHHKELARVTEEYERVIGNKDKEIARLNRRIEEDQRVAEAEIENRERRRRMSEDEAAVLRRDFLQLQSDKHLIEGRARDDIAKQYEHMDRIIRTSTNLLNEYEDRAADVEVALSQLRVLMMDHNVRSSRSRRQSDVTNGGTLSVEMLQAEIADMLERREEEKSEVGALMEKVQAARDAQLEVLSKYRQGIAEEVDTLRELQRKQEENGFGGGESSSTGNNNKNDGTGPATGNTAAGSANQQSGGGSRRSSTARGVSLSWKEPPEAGAAAPGQAGASRALNLDSPEPKPQPVKKEPEAPSTAPEARRPLKEKSPAPQGPAQKAPAAAGQGGKKGSSPSKKQGGGPNKKAGSTPRK